MSATWLLPIALIPGTWEDQEVPQDPTPATPPVTTTPLPDKGKETDRGKEADKGKEKEKEKEAEKDNKDGGLPNAPIPPTESTSASGASTPFAGLMSFMSRHETAKSSDVSEKDLPAPPEMVIDDTIKPKKGKDKGKDKGKGKA